MLLLAKPPSLIQVESFSQTTTLIKLAFWCNIYVSNDTLALSKGKGILQDKAEAARGLCVLVQPHDDLLYLACAGEELVNLFLSGIKGHVADIDRRRRQERPLVLLLVAVEPPVPVGRQPSGIL